MDRRPGNHLTTGTLTAGSAVPTGMVVFSDRRIPIAVVSLDGIGHAVFTTSTLTIGRHPMTATYVGMNQFTGSTSPTLVQVVRA